MGKIECRNLTKLYRLGGGSFEAIRALSFEVNEGELVSVVGKTGCGKSTLLSILLGLQRPTGGSVTIDHKEPYEEFDYFRGKLSAVFQTDRLLPWRTAVENAKYGLEILKTQKQEQLRKARYWLDRLGLLGFESAYPHELSGGMRQRVGIARAFSVEPEILLCDEAFGHLDEVTASRLRSDFLALVRESRKTALFITHDIEEALELGDRVLVLGKPAHLLLDLRVTPRLKEDAGKVKEMKGLIIQTIEEDEAKLVRAVRQSAGDGPKALTSR